MAATPPEITLELSGGSLTIRTAEAIYRIVVAAGPLMAGSAQPALAAPPAQPALPPSSAPAAALPDDDWDVPEPAAPAPAPAPAPAAGEGGEGGEGEEEYYRDLSHDMYREVGRLARRLSMSIRDVKLEPTGDFDLENAGQRLEQAKDQLESVVKMTEQATLRIIDQGEAIQQAAEQARGIMERMSVGAPTSTPSAGAEDEALNDARKALGEALETLTGYLQDVDQEPLKPALDKAQELLAQLESAGPAPAEAAPAAAPAAPAAPAKTRYSFPLDLVFQTTYELCTNETVKKHIKAMWDAGAKGFDAAQVEEGLNQLSPETPDEDNFLNLDLPGVLKTLFQATGQERFQQVLKKMASTVDQIFLEQNLPLEAMPQAAAPVPEPEPVPAAAVPAAGGFSPGPEFLEQLVGLVEDIRAGAAKLAPPALPANLQTLWEKVEQAQEAHSALNVVEPGLVEELETTLGVIFNSVNSIIESLSFQDLSGQAIYRIVRLLTDFQVQLLAMVVSFGSKIKAKETKAEISPEESERMAQAEVDKVLDTLGVHEDESASQGVESQAKLDQDAINNMLANMGF